MPCDNSAEPAEGARTHTVLLSGLFLGGVQVRYPTCPPADRASCSDRVSCSDRASCSDRGSSSSLTVQVFSIVNLRVDTPKTVGMRLTVRSSDMGVSQFVASSVA